VELRLDREDVVTIMAPLMRLDAKLDRVLGLLEGDDEEEEEGEADS
jgi:hypothetical protein